MRIGCEKLYEMVLSASGQLENEKELINGLNVFPVPDGDTGSNMSMTLSGARQYSPAPGENLGDCAVAVAGKMLRSARGNSGVILSLFFKGFGRGLAHLENADTPELTVALRSAVDCAYKSVMNPTEGTILTVMRRCAEDAEECCEQYIGDIEGFFVRLIATAEEALASTPELLPVLKSAGVVDAGGRGFLSVLRGMLASLRGEPVKPVEGTAPTRKQADFSAFETEEITFAYCTECIVDKDDAHKGEGAAAEMGAFAASVGDSVVFVDDEEIFKLHVHTDDPGKVLSKALEFGALATVKVENMRYQHSELAEKATDGEKAPVQKEKEPPKPYGFVCVSAGEGIAGAFLDLGADAIIKGGQTMNPSMEDILNRIDEVNAEVVYVLPNNSNIYMAAQQAAKVVKDKSVYVLPSKSIPQGISAMLAFDENKGPDSNYKEMKDAMAAVTSLSLTYADRDSQFDGQTISKGQILGLVEGKVAYVREDRLTCLTAIATEHCTAATYITVFYGSDVEADEAEQAESILRNAAPDAEITLLSGGQPIYSYLISVE